ncbi:MAG: phosphoenolpyruvate carboxylase [Nitrososphaerota archaeon]|nr:phosphoenolpyruvate carboxylase [Nitrososphaerota archaeon]MDG6939237.1 phosphoenolpyruvate carboxylase [Nitrososphaerota archaeon]
MSTQHPDNATVPPWADGEAIQEEAELHEAFHAYRELGCNEVMWDSEGKDVDTNVVRKLLSNYPDYFREHVIGEDVFLTYRIPNPQIETAERKIVTETLQTIPLSADVAGVFYNRTSTPVFEVILPFTTSGKELVYLHEYYHRAIVGVEDMVLDGSTRVRDWIGTFHPKKIAPIPLIEDSDSLLNADSIVRGYLSAAKVTGVRVFIARSDPALNYGMVPAVLLSKVALSRLGSLEEETGARIYPIMGVGTMPFRGHLSPEDPGRFLEEYRGVYTVTTQSAFRYDHPAAVVKAAISTLNSGLPSGRPVSTEGVEPHLKSAMAGFTRAYQTRVEELAPLITAVASLVPRRRARKLHIGLFGYGRSVKGVSMPRAIPFAAALYTLGIPPELLGAEAMKGLTKPEWDALGAHYLKMKDDFGFAGGLVSWENINLLADRRTDVAKAVGTKAETVKSSLGMVMSDLSAVEESLSVRLGPTGGRFKKHENFVNNFLISYLEGEEAEARAALMEAAELRRCLG